MKKNGFLKSLFAAAILSVMICFGVCSVYGAAPMKKPSVKVTCTREPSVKVSWSVQSDVSGYRIYRKTSKKERWSYLRNVNRRRSSYVDTTVEDGKTYYYTVRAFRRTRTEQGIKNQYGPYNTRGTAARLPVTKWSKLLKRYEKSSSVKQLVFVKHTGGSRANVEMYTKKRGGWNKILDCPGYTGSNGIDKQMEGDRKTPTGTFTLTHAYGIKDNPGAKMDYVKINKYLYWCGDRKYYNQLIDIREKPHQCHGEHLIDYVPHYNYGMFLDFNKKNVYGKGAAIFLHCTGSNPYTAGCVAVSEENMIKIIRNAEKNAKICIYHQ